MTDLRENERLAILALKKVDDHTDVERLTQISELKGPALMQAIFALSEKRLVELRERNQSFAYLLEEGSSYLSKGLPERQILEAVLDKGGELTTYDVGKHTGLDESVINMALGWLKKKGWATLTRRDGGILISAKRDQEQGLDEQLLILFEKKNELPIDDLTSECREALNVLRKRNLLEVVERTLREAYLTEKGRSLSEKDLKGIREISALTADVLKYDLWKEAKFVPYDVKAEPPVVYPGKKHVYLEFLEDVRRFLISMGFAEAESPYIETEFWNFDVLFQAQDHPAREVHDSYALKNPTKGRISDRGLMRRVMWTHENGWITGSTGWRYKWNPEIARRLILRTQTTATSIHYLSTHKRPPVKMFCISRNFRPDFLDATHSMEFYQCEGIVMGKDANFRHLLGFLKEFSRAFGIDKIKFKPGYFPFTEPSVEGFVQHPRLGWIECLPGGIFRPEVIKPLGLDCPVLAWGIGIDRIAMASLGIDDIRELFTKKLDWLREKPLR